MLPVDLLDHFIKLLNSIVKCPDQRRFLTLSFFFVPFTSGRVTALAVNPKSANNVYLGAADGGLWITSDGGQNWTPLTDTQPTQAVGSIAIDTATCSATGCQTIYLGTGEENFAGDNIYGAGVL